MPKLCLLGKKATLHCRRNRLEDTSLPLQNQESHFCLAQSYFQSLLPGWIAWFLPSLFDFVPHFSCVCNSSLASLKGSLVGCSFGHRYNVRGLQLGRLVHWAECKRRRSQCVLQNCLFHLCLMSKACSTLLLQSENKPSFAVQPSLSLFWSAANEPWKLFLKTSAI